TSMYVDYSDSSLKSAGRREQEVIIDGDAVAATSFGRTGRRLQYHAWTDDRNWHTESVRTERAIGRHAVSFPAHPMPSFGDTSIAVLAAARGFQPIPAKVVVNGSIFVEVEVTNTLD